MYFLNSFLVIRTKAEDLAQLSSMNFDVVYDMNGRKVEDTAPLGK